MANSDKFEDNINEGKTDRDKYNNNVRSDRQMNDTSSYHTTKTAAAANVQDLLPPAVINDIDDYLDMLYTVSGKSEKEKEIGLKLQERGSAMFLKLCRDVMNLEQLIQNSTVMGALTRVLQEEYKKSVELTFNILRYIYIYIMSSRRNRINN